MPHYPYLIIGGGMSADAAVRGVRELDATGAIGLIGAETDPPYARPPLSKALWKGEPFDSVWRKTSEAGVDLHLGRRATTLDLRGKRVADDRSVLGRRASAAPGDRRRTQRRRRARSESQGRHSRSVSRWMPTPCPTR